MTTKIKVGVLRESKNPPDKRVAITPSVGQELLKKYPNVELFIQPSEIRCFNDQEYKDLGLQLKEDLSDCDLLIGVKEVKAETFIANKKYLFFAHVAKQQFYNKNLFKDMINKKLTLMDYEYLTNRKGERVVAFGHWAGIVGAYNSLLAFGIKYKLYELKRAKDCFDYAELIEEINNKVKLPPIKILITGKGRVGKGAIEVLEHLNIKHVTVDEFLHITFKEPVICWIDADEYTSRKDGSDFEFNHFFKNPEMYKSEFKPFTRAADLFIACHFWDIKSPSLITREDLRESQFSIKVIGDVSCDINGPIASNVRPSTIDKPFYDYNTMKNKEEPAFISESNITMMAVDNLPGELPRNSSEFFANTLLNNVFDSLFLDDNEGIVNRATILEAGKITDKFSYLQDFAK